MGSGHDTKEISKIRIMFLKLLSWMVDNMGHCSYSLNRVSIFNTCLETIMAIRPAFQSLLYHFLAV